ncbi:MAG: chbG [Gammaproteobacteria bacterium]|jgi:predicted glycoside hydrolase/deacetylase ChbG (UPF0249 family)|nr:chbG [Gammaproteobacteria bacterium]
MKSIILCADDYGQTTAISQAIIALLREKRLSATSCITTIPLWREQSAWLFPFKNQIDIGLHFNLTQGAPLSPAFKAVYGDVFPSLPYLLMQSYLRQLDTSAIQSELHAQMDEFIAGVGCLPDFIDGHQHVHQFPMIRDIFLSVYESRLRQHNTYVRCVYDTKAWFSINQKGYSKRLLIQLCGARTFKQQLVRYNILHNTTFSGIYHFSQAIHYAELFPKFLQHSQTNGLIMCHPGLESLEKEDAIAVSRPLEYRYFQSQEFLNACQQYQAVISRMCSHGS